MGRRVVPQAANQDGEVRQWDVSWTEGVSPRVAITLVGMARTKCSEVKFWFCLFLKELKETF